MVTLDELNDEYKMLVYNWFYNTSTYNYYKKMYKNNEITDDELHEIVKKICNTQLLYYPVWQFAPHDKQYYYYNIMNEL